MNRHFFPRLSAVGLCCLLSSLFRPAAAQEKETVLIDRFDHTRDVPVPYVENLRKQVGRAFTDRGRHQVIDAQTLPSLSASRSTADREILLRTTGARYVISGQVSDYLFRREIVGDKPRFTTAMRLVLTGYDLRNDREIAPEEFRLSGSGATAEEADTRAFASLPYSLLFYIDRRFRFETRILRLAPADAKGRLKELYIHSGHSIGVQRKDLFLVYRETDMGEGAIAREQIGKLRVKEVMGDEVTKCTIVRGSDEIASSFATGETLIVVSDSESLF
ncbi:hypothetical protein [uncultured Rikenella sp.]|uniref:hypothetical protein n=1 Tax=uncultured Rikenella sp. TaxID=368003 RepID=UPI0027299BC7|nr:hypothetical protein [uncultured Rikenella sp.]